MQDFQIGSILGRSFSIYGKNFVPFTVLAFIMNLPALYFIQDTLGQIDSGSWDGTEGVGAMLVGMLSGQMLAAALTYGAVMELRGQHTSFSRCIQVGLVRALPVIGVAILMGLAMGIGFLLLVVPGLIIMTVLYVAIPVAVVERPGIMASLSRSSELTEGYRMHIFGLALLLGGGMLGLSYFLREIMLTDAGSVSTYLYTNLVLEILVGVLGAVVTAVVYHDLRSIKDGVNIDELAAVFE